MLIFKNFGIEFRHAPLKSIVWEKFTSSLFLPFRFSNFQRKTSIIIHQNGSGVWITAALGTVLTSILNAITAGVLR